jgi:hypothetical protein
MKFHFSVSRPEETLNPRAKMVNIYFHLHCFFSVAAFGAVLKERCALRGMREEEEEHGDHDLATQCRQPNFL